jgi:hypothetical protein
MFDSDYSGDEVSFQIDPDALFQLCKLDGKCRLAKDRFIVEASNFIFAVRVNTDARRRLPLPEALQCELPQYSWARDSGLFDW